MHSTPKSIIDIGRRRHEECGDSSNIEVDSHSKVAKTSHSNNIVDSHSKVTSISHSNDIVGSHSKVAKTSHSNDIVDSHSKVASTSHSNDVVNSHSKVASTSHGNDIVDSHSKVAPKSHSNDIVDSHSNVASISHSVAVAHKHGHRRDFHVHSKGSLYRLLTRIQFHNKNEKRAFSHETKYAGEKKHMELGSKASAKVKRRCRLRTHVSTNINQNSDKGETTGELGKGRKGRKHKGELLRSNNKRKKRKHRGKKKPQGWWARLPRRWQIAVASFFCCLLLIILSVIIAVVVYFLSKQDGQTCFNPLPGFSRMALGVDVTLVDLLPLKSNLAQGFKRDVIEISCKRGYRMGTPDGQEFDRYDQLTDGTRMETSGSFSQSSKSVKTSSEVEERFHTSVSVSASTPFGGGSASASYSQMQKTVSERESFFTETRYEVNVMTGIMDAPEFLEFTKGAQLMIDNLGDDDSQYQDFISEYGTHYFGTAVFGGMFQTTYTIDSTFLEKYTSFDAEACAGASGGIGAVSVGVEACAGGGESNSQSDFNKNSEKNSRYFGGVANLQGDTKNWSTTVKDSPVLIQGSLTAIHKLIKDRKKQAKMKKAVNQYILRKYLNNFGQLTNSPNLNERAQELLKKTSLTEEDVKALRDDALVSIGYAVFGDNNDWDIAFRVVPSDMLRNFESEKSPGYKKDCYTAWVDYQVSCVAAECAVPKGTSCENGFFRNNKLIEKKWEGVVHVVIVGYKDEKIEDTAFFKRGTSTNGHDLSWLSADTLINQTSWVSVGTGFNFSDIISAPQRNGILRSFHELMIAYDSIGIFTHPAQGTPSPKDCHMSDLVCWGDHKFFEGSCPAPRKIIIQDAFFGHQKNYRVCGQNPNIACDNTPDFKAKIKDAVAYVCDKKTKCRVRLKDQVWEKVKDDFKNPCLGVTKYLEVQYLCVNHG